MGSSTTSRSRSGTPRHDGQVFFFHFARFELGCECIVGLVVFGDDDHAACLAIEAVDDSGARGAAAAAECAEMVGERAGERAFPVSLCRMDDHAGPLVDDDDRVVFVENIERDVLRRWAFAGHGDLIDDDDVSGLEPQRSFAGGIIDEDVAGIDRAAQDRRG